MTLWNKALKALGEAKVSGWLFYNFKHRDAIADKILSVSSQAVNSRPWVYLLFAGITPVKIVHQIEESILDHLPGKKEIYTDRESFLTVLKKHAQKKPEIALHYSQSYPQLSFVDHGVALLLARLGFRLSPAENLIQQVLSTLTPKEIEFHEQAAGALYKIIEQAWIKTRKAFADKSVPLYEGEILGWITKLFKRNNLITDSSLIVGCGKNTTQPHYMPKGKGARLRPGQVIQLDIWGKLATPGGIYADISWVGVLASSVPRQAQDVFRAIAAARDGAVAYIEQTLKAEKSLSGAGVDLFAENILRRSGFAGFIKHRTGHAIDREVHGSGVNLDAREFPDARLIGEGSCFSIEPGIYLEYFGMRTEIDVYIKHNRPVVSGGPVQDEILTL